MRSYHRHCPYLSLLKERSLLTKGSTKKTFHLVLDNPQSLLSFQPGDSAGILPTNDPALVHRCIRAMKASGNESIIDPLTEKFYTLGDFLTYKANLSRVPSSLLNLLRTKQKNSDKKQFLSHLLQNEQKALLHQYIAAHELWDLLLEQEVEIEPQEICSFLLPLNPRFYSIASSPKMFPYEIHLIVTKVSYTTSGHLRNGVATQFLCELTKAQESSIPMYIQPAHHFSLPKDPSTPIILIGTGTGIAPFRSFLQERLATGAQGKNWLFFGEWNRASDFYYEDFLLSLEKDHFLRLDLAFSRDQTEKIYVQHKLLEQSKAVWQWIQEGASIYVCGNAEKMADDVDRTLKTIAQKEGKISLDGADGFLKDLREQKRYLKDVY